MSDINHYNPDTHEGHLPVRVLSYNVIDWFENISPDFLEMAKYEVDSNDLKAGIEYHIDDERIQEVSHIDDQGVIHLYESFNQYLWSICYALLILHENVVQIPEQISAGTYNAYRNASQAANAIEVFNAAMRLLEVFHRKKFFELPNPERYSSENAFYIEKTNGLYVAGLAFILTHEFAHQYYGHVMQRTGISEEELKGGEIDADDFALDQIRTSFSGNRAKTNKFGIIAALASIIFLDNSLRGGSVHPDPDARLTNLLDQMELSINDDAWGFAGLALFLWAKHYHPGEEILKNFDNDRKFFEEMLSLAGNLTKNLF